MSFSAANISLGAFIPESMIYDEIKSQESGRTLIEIYDHEIEKSKQHIGKKITKGRTDLSAPHGPPFKFGV